MLPGKRATGPARGQDPQPDGPALWVRHRPERIRAAVLTVHSGPAVGHGPSRPWQPEALRIRPVLRVAASAVPLDETLLGQVRFRQRGWNDGAAAIDVLRALSELNRLAGDVPVVLLGHAMGGRAALRAAAHPQVLGVVALAPWLPAGEPVSPLTGRSVLIMRGDGVPTAEETTEKVAEEVTMGYVAGARAAGARAGVLVVRNGGPWMLRRAAVWHRTAASAVGQVMRPKAEHATLIQQGWRSSSPLVV
ncbi:alpha/beta hydrolase [Streptomyces sp. CWNU-52B]|uniref:alpha/beta hydrolase n=1 Tax=unclassified Streptomyces TaxID=2593676 RepID=UPI0039BF031B